MNDGSYRCPHGFKYRWVKTPRRSFANLVITDLATWVEYWTPADCKLCPQNTLMDYRGEVPWQTSTPQPPSSQ